MLQQTTVAAVIPYFERFLRSFPSLTELAAASEEDVLRHWEGLGYYSRARNIHKTAQIVVAELGGAFPRHVESLTQLPGIGRYTAGAIASFAFDVRAPIVEANTLRLYSRLLGYRGDPRASDGQRLLWSFAENILPRQAPGRFNQALMELGGTVCVPEQPACDRCPVRACCASFAANLQAQIPRVAKRTAPTPVTEAAIAVHRNGSYLLMKRRAGERWAGLWDFVRFPWEPGRSDRARLRDEAEGRTGIRVEVGGLLTEIRHSVTRFRITLRCYAAEWANGEIGDSPQEMRWVKVDELGEYPLSTTGRKLAKLLAD